MQVGKCNFIEIPTALLPNVKWCCQRQHGCQMVLLWIDDDLIGYSIDGRAAQYSQGQAGHIHGRRISEEVVSSFFPLCF